MVKCDKGKIHISGPSIVILAECSMMLGAVKDALAEKNGEECAMENMKEVWDSAFLSEEEIDAKNKEMEAELSFEEVLFADALVKLLGGQ